MDRQKYTLPDGTDAGNIKTIVPSGSCGIRSSINRVIIQHLSNICSFNIIKIRAEYNKLEQMLLQMIYFNLFQSQDLPDALVSWF